MLLSLNFDDRLSILSYKHFVSLIHSDDSLVSQLKISPMRLLSVLQSSWCSLVVSQQFGTPSAGIHFHFVMIARVFCVVVA